MKTSVRVGLPVDRVIKLYLDKKHYKEWKKDFISYDLISGITDETSALTRLVFKRSVLLETIISKNLPTKIVTRYEHKQGEKTIMVHEAVHRFISSGDQATIVEVDSEVKEVNGFFMKLMMKLFAGAGKKYAQQQLDQFRKFAEANS